MGVIRATFRDALRARLAEYLGDLYSSPAAGRPTVRELPADVYPPASVSRWDVPIAAAAPIFAAQPDDAPPRKTVDFVRLERDTLATVAHGRIDVWHGLHIQSNAAYFAFAPAQEPA